MCIRDRDIATDGLTAERFEGQALARANAVQVGGTMIGFFAGGPGCLVPVSYTHLDVYKRQQAGVAQCLRELEQRRQQ